MRYKSEEKKSVEVTTQGKRKGAPKHRKKNQWGKKPNELIERGRCFESRGLFAFKEVEKFWGGGGKGERQKGLKIWKGRKKNPWGARREVGKTKRMRVTGSKGWDKRRKISLFNSASHKGKGRQIVEEGKGDSEYSEGRKQGITWRGKKKMDDEGGARGSKGKPLLQTQELKIWTTK